ncbi:MAG: TonB-dependent receptor plug domain-containing protein [Alistipes sp.]|nr:TonB-dependent receptor plug domain-containing protein [Alistipes sp.]
MKRFLLLIAATSIAFNAMAQDENLFNGLLINGDLKGIKARVEVKHRSIHTNTNAQGKFGFYNIEASDTLIIKIKKEEYVVPVAGRKSIKVVINTETPSSDFDAAEDDQLIAYGRDFVKHRDISNDPNVLLGDVMRHYGYTTLGAAIQGKIAGVSYDPQSGAITMRGKTSLNLNTSALIICEGQEMRSIDDIDIQQVDRVEALQAPNAYGVKGANGVLIVYLKRRTSAK